MYVITIVVINGNVLIGIEYIPFICFAYIFFIYATKFYFTESESKYPWLISI